MMGFGRQGMAQSEGCAFHMCTICRAPIRVSWFTVAYLGLQILAVISEWRNGAQNIGILFASTLIQFLVLYLTVLVHEFGHGTMARKLGGEINHILLWPFGGICFSSTPPQPTPRATVKNDLLVVGAGPSTHFLQTPFWGVLLWAFVAGLEQTSKCKLPAGFDGNQCFTCTGLACVWDAMVPFHQPYAYTTLNSGEQLLFILLITGVQLNVMLFLFNVFFPMYPADGSKLLVCSLMYCCGVKPYTAAKVLIICACIFAPLLIGYGLYGIYQGFQGGMNQLGLFTGLLPIFLGLMSLQEAYTIYQMRKAQTLSQHPLFVVARTDVSRRRDWAGQVATLNTGGRDDPNQAFGNNSGDTESTCCLSSCFRSCKKGDEMELSQHDEPPAPADPAQAARGREERQAFLDRLEQQRQQQAAVRR
mmetsp:Transcript_1573/g.3255  ORF Transcript_1573/g.3255 Transcript_1573/m.3255 type:complete len:418 (-) Transcript_1573:64-1317(-)